MRPMPKTKKPIGSNGLKKTQSEHNLAILRRLNNTAVLLKDKSVEELINILKSNEMEYQYLDIPEDKRVVVKSKISATDYEAIQRLIEMKRHEQTNQNELSKDNI